MPPVCSVANTLLTSSRQAPRVCEERVGGKKPLHPRLLLFFLPCLKLSGDAQSTNALRFRYSQPLNNLQVITGSGNCLPAYAKHGEYFNWEAPRASTSQQCLNDVAVRVPQPRAGLSMTALACHGAYSRGIPEQPDPAEERCGAVCQVSCI